MNRLWLQNASNRRSGSILGCADCVPARR
jgi:hypothetical protein